MPPRTNNTNTTNTRPSQNCQYCGVAAARAEPYSGVVPATSVINDDMSCMSEIVPRDASRIFWSRSGT